jgi:hypothetical protein
METTFSNATPIVKASGKPMRGHWVEALVMVAILAWFGAALATLVGEWHGAPAAPATGAVATRDLPAAQRQAATRPEQPAHATMSLI